MESNSSIQTQFVLNCLVLKDHIIFNVLELEIKPTGDWIKEHFFSINGKKLNKELLFRIITSFTHISKLNGC